MNSHNLLLLPQHRHQYQQLNLILTFIPYRLLSYIVVLWTVDIILVFLGTLIKMVGFTMMISLFGKSRKFMLLMLMLICWSMRSRANRKILCWVVANIWKWGSGFDHLFIFSCFHISFICIPHIFLALSFILPSILSLLVL